MKRLVAIALTLILCLSLCSFAAAEETDVYGKYEEPIKLTILSEDFKTGNTNYDANDPPPRLRYPERVDRRVQGLSEY